MILFSMYYVKFTKLQSHGSVCVFSSPNSWYKGIVFYSHFLVQPLHVGFTGDLGGNTITVHWYRRKANLHYVSV